MINRNAVALAQVWAVVAQSVFAFYFNVQMQIIQHDEFAAVFNCHRGHVLFQNIHKLEFMPLFLFVYLTE